MAEIITLTRKPLNLRFASICIGTTGLTTIRETVLPDGNGTIFVTAPTMTRGQKAIADYMAGDAKNVIRSYDLSGAASQGAHYAGK